RQKRPLASRYLYNGGQILLVLWCFLAISGFLETMNHGFFGEPNMEVSGMSSSEHFLHWFVDQSPAQLPSAWVLSIPVIFYQLLMLIWSLWLALFIVRLAPWVWESFRSHGAWRKAA